MTGAVPARPAPPSWARIARARIGLELRLFARERQQVVSRSAAVRRYGEHRRRHLQRAAGYSTSHHS